MKHPKPSFNAQTKVKLMNVEVEGIVNSLVYEALNAYLDENPTVAGRSSTNPHPPPAPARPHARRVTHTQVRDDRRWPTRQAG